MKIIGFFFSQEHGAGSDYSCIQCDETFSTWNNFKRHNREKHGVQGKYKCDQCKFKTNRKETLRRHKTARHCANTVVSCVLNGVLDQVTTSAATDYQQYNVTARVQVALEHIIDSVVAQADDRITMMKILIAMVARILKGMPIINRNIYK